MSSMDSGHAWRIWEHSRRIQQWWWQLGVGKKPMAMLDLEKPMMVMVTHDREGDLNLGDVATSSKTSIVGPKVDYALSSLARMFGFLPNGGRARRRWWRSPQQIFFSPFSRLDFLLFLKFFLSFSWNNSQVAQRVEKKTWPLVTTLIHDSTAENQAHLPKVSRLWHLGNPGHSF